MARALRVEDDMRSLFASLAIGLSLFTSGCFIAVEDDVDVVDPVPARGDLGIYWTFDGYYDCGVVDEVRVTLIDPYGYEYDDSRYGCAIGGLVYEEVDEGWWTIELTGYDRYGRITYGSGPVDVYVNAFAHNEFDIDMQ